VKMPAVFQDHMVLQRDQPLSIWGLATPGETVTVMLADRQARARADDSGGWKVLLAPLPATDPGDAPLQLTVTGVETTNRIDDVLIGDVWLCAGQSNMAFALERSAEASTAVPAADHPNLRLFQVQYQQAFEPVFTVEGDWRVCTPDSARKFSAVAYHFGVELQAQLGVPIGLIVASRG